MWWGNTEGKDVYRIETKGNEILRITDRSWNIEEVYVNDSRNAIIVRMIKKPTVTESEKRDVEQERKQG